MECRKGGIMEYRNNEKDKEERLGAQRGSAVDEEERE